ETRRARGAGQRAPTARSAAVRTGALTRLLPGTRRPSCLFSAPPGVRVPNAATAFPAADPPQRLLLGPGPSPVHERVTSAQARPVVGHLDPWLLEVMDQIAGMLRSV